MWLKLNIFKVDVVKNDFFKEKFKYKVKTCSLFYNEYMHNAYSANTYIYIILIKFK